MSPLIWYIHGANASPGSFCFYKRCFSAHEFRDFEYDCDREPLARVIERFTALAATEDRPIRVIGHSLGGVIGVAAAQRCPAIEKVATIGSPFGGSKVASMLRWVCRSQLLDDIHPLSAPILDLGKREVDFPVLALVTTCGHSILIHEPNDGVVTVESQQALKGPDYVVIRKNHFEVLMDAEATKILGEFIFEGV